jgi:fructose-1,6-bisphosphatase I
MVGDIHRSLIKGGVFLYPPTAKHPKGKLRLMYEANPIAMIVEQAGGTGLACTIDPARGAAPTLARLLDVKPNSIHERTSVILGSTDEVEQVAKFLDRA